MHDGLELMSRHAVQDGYVNSGYRAGNHPDWARYLLRQYHLVWATIADFPKLIQSDGRSNEDGKDEEGNQDKGYRRYIANTMGAYNFLCLKEEWVVCLP